MQDYRVVYVRGKVPVWRVEGANRIDIALTAEDALSLIGEMVKSGLSNNSEAEFRVFWDSVPAGFTVPDIENVLGGGDSATQ